MRSILVWCASLAVAVAPAPEPSPSPKPAELGKAFVLTPGQSAAFAVAGLRVTFQGVSEDSRCPVGVQCFWEGDAAVEVALEKPPAAKATRILHTSTRHPREATYEGLKVRLTDLAPVPKEGVPVATPDYRATLVVETR